MIPDKGWGRRKVKYQFLTDAIRKDLFRRACSVWMNDANVELIEDEPADITVTTITGQPKETFGYAETVPPPGAQMPTGIYLLIDWPYTDDLMLGVFIHEVGHALGLTNHSLSDSDVMYKAVDGTKPLGPTDLTRIKILYPPNIAIISIPPLRDDEKDVVRHLTYSTRDIVATVILAEDAHLLTIPVDGDVLHTRLTNYSKDGRHSIDTVKDFDAPG